MRVDSVAVTRFLRPNVLRPHLRPAQKKALLGRESVDVLWPWLSLQRFLVSGVSNGQAAQIGHRFAHHQLAFLMKPRLDFVRIELLHYTVRAGVEFLEVVRSPPHYQVAVRVELGAAIVKALRHLVAD